MSTMIERAAVEGGVLPEYVPGGETVGKDNLFKEWPEKVVVITDKTHVLYDERVNLPMNENTVLDIMERGILIPILCRRAKDGRFEVMDGRQRLKHAIEANRRLVAANQPPRQIPIRVSRAKDSEVFGNLVAANAHRRFNKHSAVARDVVRYLDQGHTEDQAAVTFNITVKQVEAYVRLAESTDELLDALDNKRLSFTTAVQLARRSHDEQRAALASDDENDLNDAGNDPGAAVAAPKSAQVDVRAAAARLVEGGKQVPAQGSTKKSEKKADKPRRLTARAVKQKLAEENGDKAAVAPGKKLLKAIVRDLDDLKARADIDKPVFSMRDIILSTEYGLMFAMVGDVADVPECVQEMLKLVARE